MDRNEQALAQLMSDPAWLREHYDEWVAVLDGEVRKSSPSRDAVEAFMEANHHEKPHLLRRISQDEVALAKLMKDAEWLKENFGKWVVLVGGKVVHSNPSPIVTDVHIKYHVKEPYLVRCIE